jgi:hypothetical protein
MENDSWALAEKAVKITITAIAILINFFIGSFLLVVLCSCVVKVATSIFFVFK